jgi:NADH-quinone oxidoreductase subunit J
MNLTFFSPTELLFFLFSSVLVLSSLIVIVKQNMVHAAMFLILAFFNASGLFLLIGAEFIAMLLIVVYVGAIAVLFLFVVMMLNSDQEIILQIDRKKPFLALIGVVLFIEIFLFIQFSSIGSYQPKIAYAINQNISNTHNIGNVLYTDFIIPFQIVGLILFVAMVGAIVLTLQQNETAMKKQNISQQISRCKKEALEVVKVASGSGLNL